MHPLGQQAVLIIARKKFGEISVDETAIDEIISKHTEVLAVKYQSCCYGDGDDIMPLSSNPNRIHTCFSHRNFPQTGYMRVIGPIKVNVITSFMVNIISQSLAFIPYSTTNTFYWHRESETLNRLLIKNIKPRSAWL